MAIIQSIEDKKGSPCFFLFTLLNSFAPVRKSSCRHFLASSKIPLGVHGRRPYYRTGFGHRASIESWFWNEICNMNDIFNCRLKGVDFSGFLIGDNQHISCLRPRALRTLLDTIAWFEIGSSNSNMLSERVSNTIWRIFVRVKNLAELGDPPFVESPPL